MSFGVFSVDGEPPRVGWRVGEHVLDLAAAGLGDEFAELDLNTFLARGRAAWEDALGRIDDHLGAGLGPLLPLEHAELRLPFSVADFVDFNSSLEHATNVGRILRPTEEPLGPNWRRLPIAYHGRAGTIVVSGTPVRRPRGQWRAEGEEEPRFGPTRKLDVELELGFVVGVPSRQGEPVTVESFADHVFGVVLVNDWSARDLQAWEYRPLGPFLGKSFATSISAWVTPLALLEGARVAAPPQEPPPLSYLDGGRDWALDIEVDLVIDSTTVSRTNARGLYWTMPQQLAHATVNGASVRTGDLFASGTISGEAPGTQGSLLELTRDGTEPIELPGGSRTFLEDGDEVVLRGRAGSVELGEVSGRVLPA